MFTIDQHYAVKKEGNYPWPCKTEKNRTIQLFPDDVLTKNNNGTFMVHTGVCCFGIVLKEDEINFIDKPVHLEIV